MKRPVLGKYPYAPYAGMHQAAHGKINDAVQPAKRQDGFRPEKGEHAQFIHPAAGQNQRKDIFHNTKPLDCRRLLVQRITHTAVDAAIIIPRKQDFFKKTGLILYR